MAISYRAAQSLIKRGDEAALRTALDNGLDPNLTNQNGWSLLMLVAIEGNLPMARVLLEKGAELNVCNQHGETALSLAAHKGHVAMLKALLDGGADKDCKPHGHPLSIWLTTASGLSAERRAEVLQALCA